jgi:hypothetical protein
MQMMNRRGAVKMLATLPALPYLRAAKPAEPEAEPAAQSSAGVAKNVNLIFHGMIAFVVYPNASPAYINAIAPIVGPHSYFAGGRTLGKLTAVPQGKIYDFRTTLVQGQLPAGINPLSYGFFPITGTPDPSFIYFNILLPVPTTVHGFRWAQRPAGKSFFSPPPPPERDPLQVPMVHVFQYSVQPKVVVSSSSFDGLAYDTTKTSYNIHFRAEPGKEASSLSSDFDTYNSLISGFNTHITSGLEGTCGPLDDPSKTVKGMVQADEATLIDLNGGIEACPGTTSSVAKKDSRLGQPVVNMMDGHLVNCLSIFAYAAT